MDEPSDEDERSHGSPGTDPDGSLDSAGEREDGAWGPADARVADDGTTDASDAGAPRREHPDAHAEEGAQRDDEGEQRDDGDGIAGDMVLEGPVEPEEASLEHAVAILAGAYLAMLAMAELIVPGYSLRTFALLTGGTLLGGVVLFTYFGIGPFELNR